MTRFKNIYVSVIVLAFISALSVFAWVKPSEEFSNSERRYLAQLPAVNFKTLASGRFMHDFEEYTLDQFPYREFLRSVKARAEFSFFNKTANNKIFMKDGYLSKLEYTLNEESLDNASKKFKTVYDSYLENTDTNVYFSIIPDKNYYLIRDDNNYLSLDYKKLVTDITKKTSYMKYIDIFGELSIDDYYKTDTHWRQEKIVPVAKKIAGEMGVTLKTEYKKVCFDKGMRGVYCGQYALPVETEPLVFLSNELLEKAVANDFLNDISIYDMTKANGRDPYEAFLGGSLSLVTIENENASTNKELVIFRDSFGSSLAPLFVEAYKKITLVDIRYIHPAMLEKYIEFKNQDVLFIYSTLILNNSEALK